MNTPVRVLCVDDSEDLAEVIGILISRSPGLESVGSLPSAENLEQEILSRRADVVLLDMTMPGPCPLDALRHLTSTASPCRVIVLSGRDDPALIDEALDAGAWGFVSKHNDPAEIVSAVHEVAQGRMRVPGQSPKHGR